MQYEKEIHLDFFLCSQQDLVWRKTCWCS